MFKTILKDMATGIDGESFDIGRVLLIFGALAFLGMSIYHVWKNHTFEPIGFGTGYGGLLTGGGFGIGLKSSTEPKPPMPAKGEE